MLRVAWTVLVIAVLLASCGGGAPPAATSAPAEATAAVSTAQEAVSPSPSAPEQGMSPGPTSVPLDRPELVGGKAQPLPTERGPWFSASGACTVCHTNMTDAAGHDVSTDILWRASMMANAARDPYWQASVRREVQEHPALQEVIEDKCATCHMPMGRTTAVAQGDKPAVLEAGMLSPDHPLHVLAMDGVSCTLCHQIQPSPSDISATFSGGYVIDLEAPQGERPAFGPFDVPPGQASVMQVSSGFAPVQSEHMRDPALCATCHTLYTPFVDDQGQVVGEFPEQTPYLEWQHSRYAGERTCQDCHMPPAQGAVSLSITGSPKREPIGQHIFAGGNVYVVEMMGLYPEDVAATASPEQFALKRDQILSQLQENAASVQVERAVREGSSLRLDVKVENRAGHKLPTGFPARRAWLHVIVRDSAGAVLFESGGFTAEGKILGNDGDEDAARYEPHHREITSPDQVQIYESVMVDMSGRVTTTLLRGARYVKDNRLLPAGFDPDAAPEDIAVQGEAAADPDFTSGGDLVRYVVDLGDHPGPYTVTVELLFQSISYRWAQNLLTAEGPEIERFASLYGRVPNIPALIDRVGVSVE